MIDGKNCIIHDAKDESFVVELVYLNKTNSIFS